jgi:hypothetical protein
LPSIPLLDVLSYQNERQRTERFTMGEKSRSTMPPDIAAESYFFATAPDGTEHKLVISVGVPDQTGPGEWRSAVSLGILDSRQPFIAGIDSWQAISLAMAFAATRLRHFHEDGWLFYWERGGDALTQQELANDVVPASDKHVIQENTGTIRTPVDRLGKR